MVNYILDDNVARMGDKGDTPVETKEPKWRKILQVTSNAAMVNLLFLISCIPIVTIGQAWSGLYSAIRYAIRGEGWFSGFKAGFKTRFLRGTVGWTLCLLLIVYMSLNMLAIIGENIVTVIVHALFLLVVLMVTGAMIPVNVYVPSPVSQWLKNAVNLVLYAPLQTGATAVLMWLPAALVLLFLKYGLVDPFLFIMVFLLVYFTFSTLIATILLKDALVRVKGETQESQEQEEDKDTYDRKAEN